MPRGVHATSDGRVEVRSGTPTYTVTLGADPDEDRCTCPWYAKYRGGRGPCKHVLAARIATHSTGEEGTTP